MASSLGAAAVFAFGVTQSSLRVSAADVWLLAGVLGAAFGYGEGARLTRRLGGWRVISWALVLSLPLTLLLSVVALRLHPLRSAVSGRAWLGFGYVGVVSMYFGFLPGIAGSRARPSRVPVRCNWRSQCSDVLVLAAARGARDCANVGDGRLRGAVRSVGDAQPHFLVDSVHLLGHSPPAI